MALRLCTGRTVHRGSRSVAPPFLDHGTRRGWGVSFTPRQFFTPGKTRYPLYRRLGGPQGLSGRVRKISPPTGIRSTDRPARSQSLYRLRYPAKDLSLRVPVFQTAALKFSRTPCTKRKSAYYVLFCENVRRFDCRSTPQPRHTTTAKTVYKQ